MTEQDPMNDRETFVAALLRYTLSRGDVESRVARVMRSIDQNSPELALAGDRPPHRSAWRIGGALGALAAAAAIMVVILVSSPSQVSAVESVARALRSEASQSVRRFHITIDPPLQQPVSEDGKRMQRPPGQLSGVLVSDGKGRMVCSMRLHDGDCIVLGRDGDEMWEIRPQQDFAQTVADAPRGWSSWLESADGELFVDSMATILETLQGPYTLEVAKSDDEPISGTVRIDAVRTSDDKRLPRSASVWIHQPTAEVMRMDMSWDPRTNETEPQPRRQGRPDRGGPPGAAPRPDRGPDGAPPHDASRPEGAPPARPRPHGQGANSGRDRLPPGLPSRPSGTLRFERDMDAQLEDADFDPVKYVLDPCANAAP